MLTNTQFALFLREPISSPTELFISLKEKTSDYFDDEVTILPVPPDVPGEIPIVIMNSRTGRASLTISRTRVDVRFDHLVHEGGLAWEDACECLHRVLPVIGDSSLARFGCSTISFEACQDPVAVIQDRYFASRFAKECNELSFRVNEPFLMGAVHYNCVKNIQSTVLNTNGKALSGISTTVDINSHQNVMQINKEVVLAILRQTEKIALS